MITLKALEISQREDFIKDLQRAFRGGFEAEFGTQNEEIISKSEIEDSLNKKGAQGLCVMQNGQNVGGAVVCIDEVAQENDLELFFIKQNAQSKGIGFQAWQLIEQKYPHTKLWRTITPYFEKRNIHFYVNRCGFKIIEFFNPRHKDPNMPDMWGKEDMDYAFAFEKQMR